jgi:hypothetical protein
MKSLRFIALGFGLLLATAAANAQGVTVHANIPFTFAVGNQSLPAGEYKIQPTFGDSVVLTIRSSDGKRTASTITEACGSRDPSDKTELVFHRVGHRYFLSQIRVEGSDLGRQLPKNRAEAEVALNQKADNVVVAAELLNR